MSWDRIINYYLDVDGSGGLVLLRQKTPEALQRAEDILQGDYATIRLWFRQRAATTGSPTSAIELPASDNIVFAAKRADDLEADSLLFSATNFSKAGTDDDIYYEAELNLNTTELDDAFGDLAGNILTCRVDVEVQNSDNSRRKTLQFEQRVLRQVYGGEADPTPGTPDYPLPSSLCVVVDPPADATDFDDLPGGVAPTDRNYQAMDSNYLYTIAAGESSWRRSARAVWSMLIATLFVAGGFAAENDIPFVQEDDQGQLREKTLPADADAYKTELSLDAVDNTADTDKPVSTAVDARFDAFAADPAAETDWTPATWLTAIGAEASDADLTAIAALTTTAYGRSLLELADAASLRSLAGLVIGTDVPAISDTGAIAYVTADGDDGTGTVGRMDLPFATIDAALDAVTGSPTTVRVGVGTFAAWKNTKLEDGDQIIGSGMPAITGSSMSAGGTIIGATSGAPTANEVAIANLGFDASAAAADALIISAGSGETLRGWTLKNISALGSSGSNGFTAIAVNNHEDAILSNIVTSTSSNGLFVKGKRIRILGLTAYDHQLSALTIKSRDDGDTRDVVASNIRITQPITGKGVVIDAVSGHNVESVAISNVQVTGASRAISMTAAAGTASRIIGAVITNATLSGNVSAVFSSGGLIDCVIGPGVAVGSISSSGAIVLGTTASAAPYERVLITGWSVTDSTASGIYISNAGSVFVTNTVLSDNGDFGITEVSTADVYLAGVGGTGNTSGFSSGTFRPISPIMQPYTLVQQTSSSSLTASGSQNLFVYTQTPTNYLTADGESIRVRVWGTFAANSNTKQVRLRLQNTDIAASASAAQSGGSWVCEGILTRTGTATQNITCTFAVTPGGAMANTVTASTGSVDLTVPQNLRLEATGGAADDVVVLGAYVEVLPAP